MTAARYYSDSLRKQILSGKPLPKWLERHSRKSYIITANLSSVPWRCKWKIKLLYWYARVKSAETGIEHVVDHVIPLTHPNVCGLSVHQNMKVVPKAHNARKGNKWQPDQIELDLNGQLRLWNNG